MKKFEKQLLTDLKEDYRENVPLADIKKAMGSISELIGNPRFKAEVQITINKRYDLAGVEILPAALPAALQVPVPFYMLGLTDWQGNYPKSRQIVPVNQNFQLFVVAIIVNPGAIFPFNLMSIGDLVLGYVNVATGIACNIWVHCNNVAYGTFLNSFASDLIVLNLLRYSVLIINVNQLINPLIFGYQTLLGKLKTDSVDPRTYITNETFQQQISDIPINLPIDKNLMIGSQMEFDCQTVIFNLSVGKIDKITYR